QNQIVHHITELIARLNNRNDIGKTMWIILKQAQLNLKSRKCIPGLSLQRLEQINIRNNLCYKITKKAKKLKIDFRSAELEE
ncbi:10697_t:CDS:1, partial [Racocetra persica]